MVDLQAESWSWDRWPSLGFLLRVDLRQYGREEDCNTAPPKKETKTRAREIVREAGLRKAMSPGGGL